MTSSRLYTWAEVAQLMERDLGARVSLPRLMTAVYARRSGGRRRRLIEALPEPVEVAGHAGSVFPADEVDAWLSQHPDNVGERNTDRLLEWVRTASDRRDAIGVARRFGASWEQISDALSAADGIDHHPAMVRRGYCPRT